MYNPWHGCHKYSEGCRNCYMFYFDSKRGIDSNIITKTRNFYMPLQKDKKGNYKFSDQTLFVCLTSDFFIEEADLWRDEVWDMIRIRQDIKFKIFNKRASRILENLPQDFKESFSNVELAISCENQRCMDERAPYILALPTNNISLHVSPMLERVDVRNLLKSGKIKEVCVSGENYANARVLNFDWVLDLWHQTKACNVKFYFYHTGKKLLKDGRVYIIPHSKGEEQAMRANLNSNQF